MPSNLVLRDVYKTYTYDQDKAVPPEETVTRVKEIFRQAGLDILKQTVRIDSGRLGIPVFVSVCGAEALRVIGTQKQMGKGATPAQAEASALMELVERYSFFHFIHRQTSLVADYEQVSDAAMPLDALMRSVHHDSDDESRARRVLEGIPLQWTWGRNLSDQRDVLIPFNWFFDINQFNGSSAGNCIEEAVLQGACEVVERHVSAVISDERHETAIIDLSSLQDAAAIELIRKFRAQDIQLFVRDFSLGLGIPSVGALAWDPSTFPNRSEIVFTAGTHTNPEKAVVRALTEIAQLSGDFDTTGKYIASGLPKPCSLDDVAYMSGTGGSSIAIHQLPTQAHQNMNVELVRCMEALNLRGFQLFAINVAHPQLGIPAVYALIPGCRFRERAKRSSIPFFAAKIAVQTLEPLQALYRLNRMSELYPEQYYLYYYTGVCHANLGDMKQALYFFQEAMERAPETEDAASIQCYIGICHQNLEEYHRAVEELEKAVLMDPECKEAHNALGFCHFKLKEHDRSIECFEQVLKLDPGSAIDYANIASNLKELGRIEEAIQLYRVALDLDADIEFARRHLELLLKERTPPPRPEQEAS